MLQTDEAVTRWCWYSYFMFELLLTLVLVWIGYASDCRVEDDYIPPWLRKLFVLDIAIGAISLTNDFHQLVFTFSASMVGTTDHYGYGPAYGVIMAVIAVQFFSGLGILFYKARQQRSLNGKAVVPSVLLLLFILYLYGYIVGYGPVRKTEVVLATILFILLFLCSAFWAGLIASNRGYIDLFRRSDLDMQIFREDGNLAYASGAGQALAAEDVSLSTMPIPGGYVVCRQDVRALRQKQRDLTVLAKSLERSYDLLKREEQLRRDYISLKTRQRLYEELEQVIASKRKPMNKYMTVLQGAVPGPEADHAVRRLNILGCYIKKRCVMLLRGKEHNRLYAEELHMAAEETKKYAAEAGLTCGLLFSLSGLMNTAGAMLLYDAYESWIEQILLHGASSVLFNFYAEGQTCCLAILFEEAYAWLPAAMDQLRKNVPSDALAMTSHDDGDMVSVVMSLSKGGAVRE